MKKFILGSFMIFCTILTVNAQSANQEVENAVEFLKQAMISGNQKDLESIASADLSYGHSSGKIQNKTEFVNGIASGASDFVSIDLSDQTIIVKGRTAIVRHKLYAKTNDGGKPGEVKLGIMLVFAKEGKAWKLLARQAYKI